MIPVPPSGDGSIPAFYMSRTEIPWEVYDVFVYRLDEEAGQPGIDAVSRPSKPYLPPDRGFGHDGYPAISVSFRAAEEFCAWLSARSGLEVRLPTEDEWEHAAAAPCAAPLPDCAWFAGNSGGVPHPVATRLPNGLGLCDMFGNAGEWVRGRDGRPVLKGGSYGDHLDRLTPAYRAEQTPAWNASDPQIPKSRWWLSDGPFAGFRIVCEPPGGR
jgi:formylglycine-generating enzyme required for sulfatase activity